jgi:hypothetical protein
MKQTLSISVIIFTALISSGQNVGIGTTSPVEKLEVGGNIKSTGTIKANQFQFISPKTYYYSLSGADFTPKNTNDEMHKENITAGGAYFLSSTEGMVAAVHLPNGATVTKMTAYFNDNGIAVDLRVMLRPNAGFSPVASITTSGIPGDANLYDNSISNGVINNSANAYVIDATPIGGAWPAANLIIRKVIIEYQLSEF